jgi:aspartate/methionine/tyrosine aminotransferase
MTNQKFADRMRFIKPATSQELIAKVKAMRTDGIEVFDFSDQGASPEVARRAAVKKINEPSGSTYSDTRGLHELRQEIAKKTSPTKG